ncbi:ABC transporter ATP-binding protein [Marinisporobacter balticus]|uniref:Iron complex transport system ATP-binding protein n=1 Tax=Marinisporobacter balticus TaxID=2018667 RepID=A0A4R2KNB2_9FIRM|nr:ABC transporter ATP-binding protein [Marinisporobacter balticus]TCO72279.1 iron complex transport system ATP-binding protein [Marinisporobacter balticus]
MYSVKNLYFSYQDQKILKNINFFIERGKLTTIIGPNGSGKTTLLNLITGQLDVCSGEICFQNKLLKSYSIKALSQKTAIVSQNVEVHFPFTCMEVVMMGRNPFKSRMKNLNKKDLDVVLKCMEMTETLGFANKSITNLSGGERQRVMIAKALAQTPEVLFLDEAFSNMDIQYTIKLLNLLKDKVQKEKLTVISIMHDLNLTDLFSDQILALKNGKMVEYGKTQEVIRPSLIKELFGVNVRKNEEKGLVILPTI